ncbi:hypothetical protein [Desulfitobacterium sp. Sab5]|uniref:hypothetical protein n=1 Tax=Desulfitobacterium TaxID=36853 RepID=UPI003CFA5A7A
MLSTAENMIIALLLILVFTFSRRLFGHNELDIKTKRHYPEKPKSSLKNKELRSKVMDRSRSKEVISNRSKNYSLKKRKTRIKANADRPASVLLHPHTLEKARKEFLEYASSFKGLYEPLYQASQDNLRESSQNELLKAWEDKIKATHSQYLELIWENSGYQWASRKGIVGKAYWELWLKHLKDCGLQRSQESGQIYWSLNGCILEQSNHENEKSS